MKALLLAATMGVASLSVADKPVILSPSDLPPVRFTFPKAPSAMIGDPAYRAKMPELRREAERLLRDYDIRDPSITMQLRFGLAAVAILEGRKADAQKLVADYRAGETKPQLKRLGGIQLDIAAAMLDVPTAQRCDAAVKVVTAAVDGADPAVIRDQFVGFMGGLQTTSVSYSASGAAGFLDPVAKQRGSLDVLQSLRIAGMTVLTSAIPECRAPLIAAARAWVDAPANRPVDIWPYRQPPADAFTKVSPVVVAVWDRGFDGTLFPGQLANDPAEPRDGIDNDGNGVIDDSNGPTYDVRLFPQVDAMAKPTAFLQSRIASQMAYDKGELDIGYGFDTVEARMFAEYARTASTEEQSDEFFAYMENRGRVHGTACASEIADGAPFVRLYNVAALPWGRGEDKLAIPYDEATIDRWAKAIDRIGVRMRGAGVRVVNMSWGLTAEEIIEQLLERGLEVDTAKAKARGVAMQKTIAVALEKMMRASPNILFVIAAGNSNQSDDIQADAVQQFKLPNMMIVGATGTNGKPTAFTVFGGSVSLYAQGEAVKLRWPGNIVLHTSGTSMAAPLAARAAAQMLAVNPKLSAAQVRDGLIASATVGDGSLKLMHPAAAVRWAMR